MKRAADLEQGGVGYYETGSYAQGGVLGLYGGKGVPPPATRGKGVIVPQGTKHVKEGVPPKNANFSTKSVKFLKKSQFFMEIFSSLEKFERVLENFRILRKMLGNTPIFVLKCVDFENFRLKFW